MARRKNKKRTHRDMGINEADASQLDLLSIPETQSVSNEGAAKQDLQECSAELPQKSDPTTEIDLTAAGAPELTDATIGQRLRFAREQRGWTCEDVGSRLKLQARLIKRIEEDDFSGIAHAVYLRGYLTSYARLLDMPQILAEKVIAERGVQAPLVSTGRVSRSRYLMDRYSVSATYLILTALVVGPAVWLATHGGLEQNLARTVLLDAPPVSEVATTSPAIADKSAAAASETPAAAASPSADPVMNAIAEVDPPAESPAPIIASMAPFSASQQMTKTDGSSASMPVTSGRHSLSLKLKLASWVEVVDANGSRIEYGLLGAGVERNYASDTALTVRIGNAEGAEVVADGIRVDLAPFQRANVARLRLFGGDKLASRVDS
jgi:cytoskeleton protein RodZ